MLKRKSNSLIWLGILVGCVTVVLALPAGAQNERSTRAPDIGKTAGGTVRQAFSGKVQSVDLKRKLLTVGTVEGNVTEYFPVKKDVSVSTAVGGKMKVKELEPGTNILIYYTVKGDRRSVSEIVVLTAGSAEKETEAKKNNPPS